MTYDEGGQQWWYGNVKGRNLGLNTVINDPISIKLLDELNIDNLCWESDFPHSDGTWPQAPEALVQLLNGVPAEAVARITCENAMRHYQFDPFAHRPKEKCTAAALRADSPDVDVVTRVGRQASERDLELWRQITSRSRSAPAPAVPR